MKYIFAHLSIKTKLAIGFGCAILFLALSVLGNSYFSQVFVNGFHQAYLANQATAEIEKIKQKVDSLWEPVKLSQKNGYQDSHKDIYQGRYRDLNQSISHLDTILPQTNVCLVTYGNAKKDIQEFGKQLHMFFANNGTNAQGLEKHRDQAIASLGNLQQFFYEQTSTSFEAIYKNRHDFIFAGLLLASLLIVILILIGMTVTQSISRPVKSLAAGALKVAAGDLSHQIKIFHNDEIGSLTHVFNKMVTKLQKIQNENIREREFTENIVSSMVNALFVLDENLKIKKINDATGLLIDCPNDVIIGQSFERYLTAGSQSILLDMQNKKFIPIQEATLLNIRNEWVSVYFGASPLKRQNDQWQGYVCVVQDITEQKRLENDKFKAEQQLIQAQKLESIGQMAGGIAHDFNNILSPIIGYAELMLDDNQQNSQSKNRTNGIIQAAVRGSQLVSQLLGFARDKEYKVESLKINAIIEEAKMMLALIVNKDVKIETHLDQSLWYVDGDSNQILQILMNLGVNARDAMSEGGVITISTTNLVILDDDQNYDVSLKPGKYIQMSIEDQGIGMPEDMSKMIFDPFYTTKAVGKGTGLGLSVVYGIVNDHKGIIKVESKQNEGTEFKIYLPAYKIKKEEKSRQKIDHSVSKNIFKGLNILIVDDESSIRDISTAIITRLGAKVLSACNGQEAVRTFEKHQKELHLVIMDVIMPEKNGIQAYKEIRHFNPHVKVIFCSGYTKTDDIRGILNHANVEFLHKPFHTNELINKIILFLQQDDFANQSQVSLS